VIVDFFRDWDSEQYTVDDAMVIATADQMPVYGDIDSINLMFSPFDVDV
jgi:hypothetical protein